MALLKQIDIITKNGFTSGINIALLDHSSLFSCRVIKHELVDGVVIPHVEFVKWVFQGKQAICLKNEYANYYQCKNCKVPKVDVSKDPMLSYVYIEATNKKTSRVSWVTPDDLFVSNVSLDSLFTMIQFKNTHIGRSTNSAWIMERKPITL